MRKRFTLLWAMVILGVAMVLPATTAAATYGNIVFKSGYCTGSTVHATFKLTKYSGFFATQLSMTVKGQGFHAGKWRNEYNVGTYYVNTNGGSGGWIFKDTFFYTPGDNGSHRILVIGKIWNGSHLVASGQAHSGFC